MKIVVKTFQGCVEKVLVDGIEQEFIEENIVVEATPTKPTFCNKCGKEVEKTDLNEDGLCDSCYNKIEKTFKVKLKWEREISVGEFKGFTDEEIREQAQNKIDECELKETPIYSEMELVNVKTGHKISLGYPD